MRRFWLWVAKWWLKATWSLRRADESSKQLLAKELYRQTGYKITEDKR